MKFLILVSVLFSSVSSLAYSGDKLCYQEGRNLLRSLYSNGWNGKLLSAKMDEYYVGENYAGNKIVQYTYNAETDDGPAYARITMTKKGCKALVSSTHSSKEAMESDDHEAAQYSGE